MSACGDSTTSDAPSTTATETTQPSAVATSDGAEFAIRLVRFDAPMVVIVNIGEERGSLAGHWLCQRPAYVEIPDFELNPDESVAISLGGTEFLPPPGALAVSVAHGIGPMDPRGGEIGLFSRPSFDVPGAVVSYVKWGTDIEGRSPAAIEAGVWTAGEFVATTDTSVLIESSDPSVVGPSNWTASA